MKGRVILTIGFFGFLICGAALDCPNWALAMVCCFAALLAMMAGIYQIRKEEEHQDTGGGLEVHLSENRDYTFREWLTNTDPRW